MKLPVHLPNAVRAVVICLVLIGLATAVGAQQAPSPKVAVIDVQRLLTDSAQGQEAMEKLKTLGESKRAQVESLQGEITDLRNRLTEGQLSLSEERQEELEKELQAKLVEARRVQEDASRELEREQDKALAAIESQVIPLIATIAEEDGYTMIFNKFQSGLLFATESIDITDSVLARFNTESSGGE